MSGLATGVSLSCPGTGSMTLVGHWGRCHLLTERRSLPCALTEHVFSPAPSSSVDAEDARNATCLMLAWPGDRSPLGLCPVAAGLAGKGAQQWGASEWNPAFQPWGCCIGLPHVTSQAPMLLLLKGARPDGQVESFLPGGVCPPLPGGGARLGPPLALVRVLSCCACLVWSGEKNGMMLEEGKDCLAFIESTLCFSSPSQRSGLSGVSGQSARASQVGYYYDHYYCHHLYKTNDMAS
ncbi:LOW QUALITY PROTEIN: uncharacterized protein LOC105717314 [Aotus nancymaae]|uniref:LOW QUALITY PROTEIN: uncharacterized protein LOC105717314 n=1 Tax=Aotus nancymaae TaxID=37293 RepID=UPI0030FE0E95